jgi:hypothetical protein
MSREVSLVQLPPEIEDLVGRLRKKLAQNNMAFAALYVCTQTNGDMIVIDDRMPTDMRIEMLADLIRSAQETLAYYKGMQ